MLGTRIGAHSVIWGLVAQFYDRNSLIINCISLSRVLFISWFRKTRHSLLLKTLNSAFRSLSFIFSQNETLNVLSLICKFKYLFVILVRVIHAEYMKRIRFDPLSRYTFCCIRAKNTNSIKKWTEQAAARTTVWTICNICFVYHVLWIILYDIY